MTRLTFGKRLAEVREAARWSQDRLAKATGYSSHTTVSHWEDDKWGGSQTGEPFPLDDLNKLIHALAPVSPKLQTEKAIIEFIELAGYSPDMVDPWWQEFLANRPRMRKVMSSPWTQVPPAWRLPRAELAAQVREALLHLPSEGRRIAVYGPAGSGKRALLDILKEDAALATAFPAGVLTAELGRKPNVLSWQSLWADAAGTQLASFDQNPQARLVRLREIMRPGRWLQLIAEVYSAEDAELLLAGGPGSAAILTTPDRAVFEALSRYLPAGQQIEVGSLTREEAAELWRKGGRVDMLSAEELMWLHTYVQGNAFALSGAFALVRQHGLAYVREALTHADVFPLPTDVEAHVFHVLHAARDLVSAEARTALERLAEFPRLRLYTLPGSQALWECSLQQAQRRLSELAAYGLVALKYNSNGTLLGYTLHEQTYRFVRHLAIQRGVCVTVADRLWRPWLERYFGSPAGQQEQAELQRRLRAVGGNKCLWLVQTALGRLHQPWWRVLSDIWRQGRSDMEFLLDAPEMTTAEWCLAAWLRREGIALERQTPLQMFGVGVASTAFKIGLGPAGWVAASTDLATVGATAAGVFRVVVHFQNWLKLLTLVFGPLLEARLAVKKAEGEMGL